MLRKSLKKFFSWKRLYFSLSNISLNVPLDSFPLKYVCLTLNVTEASSTEYFRPKIKFRQEKRTKTKMAEKDDKMAAQNQYEKEMYEKYFIFTRLFHIQS